ncbi:hypothetical protein GCM10009000_074070 [Halobacterium noricense]|uniref:Uncharacterized protein n=1 Tax=Haladaptatus pallidirubidus TaxID=1008152 RepID=A0AAV3ULZ8_9EURY
MYETESVVRPLIDTMLAVSFVKPWAGLTSEKTRNTVGSNQISGIVAVVNQSFRPVYSSAKNNQRTGTAVAQTPIKDAQRAACERVELVRKGREKKHQPVTASMSDANEIAPGTSRFDHACRARRRPIAPPTAVPMSTTPPKRVIDPNMTDHTRVRTSDT